MGKSKKEKRAAAKRQRTQQQQPQQFLPPSWPMMQQPMMMQQQQPMAMSAAAEESSTSSSESSSSARQKGKGKKRVNSYDLSPSAKITASATYFTELPKTRKAQGLEFIDASLDAAATAHLENGAVDKLAWLLCRVRPNTKMCDMRCKRYADLFAVMQKAHARLQSDDPHVVESLIAQKFENLDEKAAAEGWKEEWMAIKKKSEKAKRSDAAKEEAAQEAAAQLVLGPGLVPEPPAAAAAFAASQRQAAGVEAGTFKAHAKAAQLALFSMGPSGGGVAGAQASGLQERLALEDEMRPEGSAEGVTLHSEMAQRLKDNEAMARDLTQRLEESEAQAQAQAKAATQAKAAAQAQAQAQTQAHATAAAQAKAAALSNIVIRLSISKKRSSS